MAEIKNDCINRGFFTRAKADLCQKQLGPNYEVKIALGAVRVGKLIYQVQPKVVQNAANQFGMIDRFLAMFSPR